LKSYSNSAYIKLDRKMKNKKVAALLSLLFPGLGHLYIGKYIDGIIFLLAGLFLWFVAYLKSELIFQFNNQAVIILVALIGFYLYTIFDSYKKA